MLVLIDPIKTLQRSIQTLESDATKMRLALPSGALDDRDDRMNDLESELARFRAYLAEAEQIAPELNGKVAPVRQAEESMKLAKYDLDHTLVRAPIDGVVSGQALPSGTLPDPQPRAARQTDTPETSQDFQVIVSITDNREDQPLRIGGTGRAIIFADGGMGGVNQVASLLVHIMAFMDNFFPKPSLTPLLIGSVLVLACIGVVCLSSNPVELN